MCTLPRCASFVRGWGNEGRGDGGPNLFRALGGRKEEHSPCVCRKLHRHFLHGGTHFLIIVESKFQRASGGIKTRWFFRRGSSSLQRAMSWEHSVAVEASLLTLGVKRTRTMAARGFDTLQTHIHWVRRLHAARLRSSLSSYGVLLCYSHTRYATPAPWGHILGSCCLGTPV